MKLLEARVLLGPNLWSAREVLEARVDPGSGSTGLSPAAFAAIKQELPELAQVTNDLGTLIGAISASLQVRSGSEATFVRSLPSAEGSSLVVVVGFENETLARIAVGTAIDLIRSASQGEVIDLKPILTSLHILNDDTRTGPTTTAMLRAARNLKVPLRLVEPEYSFIILGQGMKQRRIYGSATERTSLVATNVSTDKHMTKERLRAYGLSVLEGYPANTAEEAWAIAERIGVPVVIKRRNGDYGEGMTLDVRTREQAFAGFEVAQRVPSEVIVERFAPGCDHRLLVVDGQLVAVSRREPPTVVGDGRSTVAQLVELLNESDPLRGETWDSPRMKIKLEPDALVCLAEQGFTPDSIPSRDQRVWIRRNSHVSTGGMLWDVTDLVHPDTAEQAISAAKVLGLDVAGIDLMACDIREPLKEQGGAILEINAGPGLDLHLAPWSDRPREVGEAIIASLFDDLSALRIPTIAILTTNESTLPSQVEQGLHDQGLKVARASRLGTSYLGRPAVSSDARHPLVGREILTHPSVELAIFEVSDEIIASEGLAFDRCQVVVIPGIRSPQGRLPGLQTPEELLISLLEAEGTLVLNADDPDVVGLRNATDRQVILYTVDPKNPEVTAHRSAGGQAIIIGEPVDVSLDDVVLSTILTTLSKS